MSTIVQPDDQTISQQRAVPTSIRKRDGRVIRFDSTKIVEAVRKAFVACGMGTSELHASEVALEVMSRLSEMGEETPDVETIQDLSRRRSWTRGMTTSPKHTSCTDSAAPSPVTSSQH